MTWGGRGGGVGRGLGGGNMLNFHATSAIYMGKALKFA